MPLLLMNFCKYNTVSEEYLACALQWWDTGHCCPECILIK